MKEDYQAPKVGKGDRKEADKSPPKKTKKTNNVVDFSDPDTKMARELEGQYARFQHKELIAIIKRMPVKELKKITGEFEKYLVQSSRGIYTDIYRRDGMVHPLIQDQLVAFIRREKPELVAMVATYDMWMLEEQVIVQCAHT